MSTKGKLGDIEAQLAAETQPKSQRNFDSPPLHLWHPTLSGDIPIQIKADGTWFHEGGEIKRAALVRMFASILRREDDGYYYLVTPVEKWRITVDLHPLTVIDVNSHVENAVSILEVELNIGKKVSVGAEYPLHLEPSVGDIATINLWHGLTAIFTRSAWYRLVEFAESDADATWVMSDGERFVLQEN